MKLDIDGVLNVTAIEKSTGLSKQIAISRALEVKSEAEIARARKRIEKLCQTERSSFAQTGETDEEDTEDPLVENSIPRPAAPKTVEAGPVDNGWPALERTGRDLVARSRKLLDISHEEDRESIVDMNEAIEAAITARDPQALSQAIDSLKEFLFFVEGHE